MLVRKQLFSCECYLSRAWDLRNVSSENFEDIDRWYFLSKHNGWLLGWRS